MLQVQPNYVRRKRILARKLYRFANWSKFYIAHPQGTEKALKGKGEKFAANENVFYADIRPPRL